MKRAQNTLDYTHNLALISNNQHCKVHDVGKVNIKMFDDHEFLLHSVRYVLELMHNILSMSMFDDLGYCTIVENEVTGISHGGGDHG